jgi:integrase
VKALADDVEDDGETAVFLTMEHRKALIDAAQPPCAAFLRGLEVTGARPKEIAAANASDFDGNTLRLAHRKGRPPRLRVRHVVLSTDGIEFFKEHTAGKLPEAPIFTEDGERAWRRHIWAREIRVAIAKVNERARGKARIPAGASAYSFRHARISELLQMHGVDPLTVAHQTGTSLAMIEKAYLRFIPEALREKLLSASA